MIEERSGAWVGPTIYGFCQKLGQRRPSTAIERRVCCLNYRSPTYHPQFLLYFCSLIPPYSYYTPSFFFKAWHCSRLLNIRGLSKATVVFASKPVPPKFLIASRLCKIQSLFHLLYPNSVSHLFNIPASLHSKTSSSYNSIPKNATVTSAAFAFSLRFPDDSPPYCLHWFTFLSRSYRW